MPYDNFLYTVFKKFREEQDEHGDIEEGDQFIYVLNDAVIIIGLEHRELKVNVVAGVPTRLDIDTNLIEKDDGGGICH